MTDEIAELHPIDAPRAMERSPLEIQAGAFVDKYAPETSDMRGFLEGLAQSEDLREFTRLVNTHTSYSSSLFNWITAELRKYRIAEFMLTREGGKE